MRFLLSPLWSQHLSGQDWLCAWSAPRVTSIHSVSAFSCPFHDLGMACSSAHPGCQNYLSRCWEGIWALIHIGLTDGCAGSFRSPGKSGECTYYVTNPPGPGEEALFSSFFDEEEELLGVR